MGRKVPPPYSAEVKAEAVRFVGEGGYTIKEAADVVGYLDMSVRAWVARTEVDSGAKEGLTTDERSELARLRRQVRVLEEEKEILKRAEGWFAKETHSTS